MKKIKLNGKYGEGKFSLVDDSDFESVNMFKWYLSGRYPVKSFGKRPNRKKISLHRFLLDTPNGMVVDHINGDGLDNQRKNLRVCTVAQNTINSSKRINTTSSKYKGVTKNNKPYRAYIGTKTLGYFKTEKEAAEAYNNAAISIYGDFAKLNIIN